MGAQRFYDRHGALCLALAAALLMGLVLFAGGGAGLSNNGDFVRVMSANHLSFADSTAAFVYEDTFRMDFEGPITPGVVRDLLFSLDGVGGYPSIHVAFVRLSLLGNLAVNALFGLSPNVYHIQVLGAIYLFCYAVLLFLLFRSFRLPKWGVDLAVKLVILFVLCDEGYITYFNSLYSEPVQMLGLLAMAVFALRALGGKGSLTVNSLCFFLACLVYGWSKFVNLPAAALCVICLGTVFLLGAEKRRRLPIAACGLVCVALLGAVYLALPGWMDYETNYNAVFYGILKDTTPQQQAEYLAELGLPQEMAELADCNYYMERTVAFHANADYQAAFGQLSKLDLLAFYLRHPLYYLQKLDVAMAHSGFIRPYYLSNLDATHPRLTFAGRFGGWSWLRGQLPVNTWVFSILTVAAGCLCLWRVLVQSGGEHAKRKTVLLLLALLGTLCYQFGIPTVTNGEGDLAKHMFAYAQLLDLLLLFLLVRLGYALCGARRLRSPAPLLAIALAAAVCLSLAAPSVYRGARSLSHGVGGHVTFGAWEGRAIEWEIVSAEDGQVVLLALDGVGSRAFSAANSNRWSDSDLRNWLNGEFLANAFTSEERSLILSREHRVLLSGPYKAQATSGYNDFFAFHVPKYSDRGMETSLAETTSDAVRLPDIRLLADLSRRGLLDPTPCWMETPYYNNGIMVRCLGPDGYFYMKDAAEPLTVRPVIVLSQLP